MSDPVKIKFQRIHANAKMPTRATPGSAGFDLYAVSTTWFGNMIHVSTGLMVEFPKEYQLQLHGRSGLSTKYGISLANNVGIIDSDYRGELKLVFTVNALPLDVMASNHNAFEALKPGNRVAQAILVPLPDVIWEEVEEISESLRGAGGFGSTGTN